MLKTHSAIRETRIIPSECKEFFLPLNLDDFSILRNEGVILGGISRLKPGYQIGRLNPDFDLLLYTIDGCGHFFSGHQSGDLVRGDALFARHSTEYFYHVGGDSWNILWFHVSKKSPWQNCFSEKIKVFKSSLYQKIFYCAQQIFEEISTKSFNNLYICQLYCRLICEYVKEELNVAVSSPVLDGLIRSMKTSLSEEWSLDQMARISGYSKGHLHQLFKSHVGVTPHSYLRTLRIEHAKKLLLESNRTIESIAQMVGYKDGFSFSNAFKRETSHPPSDFRRVHGAQLSFTSEPLSKVSPI